ncbi:MAG: FG-GAP-like repeat-containing protein [Bifidobacteriaceae bacterium]|jgi:uncharacterized protein YkwD|nr:FG-GAP-like repeat-containing protein [Bifidobacteriaceae bacterium]
MIPKLHRRIFRSGLIVLTTAALAVTGLAGVAAQGAPEPAPEPNPAGEAEPLAYAPIDTSDKAAVRDAYVDYLPTQSVPMGWTGDAATCDPGTVSAEAQAATFQALNYFRAMAGLPTQVTENTTASAIAQRTALMLYANNASNHYPPTTWLCWTNNGAFIASKANIYRGVPGAQAMAGYVADPGNDTTAGHRRWILSPAQQTMGSGSTVGSNVLVWGDGQGSCTSASCTATEWDPLESPTFTNPRGLSWSNPELVAWPPAGYFPYQLASMAYFGQIVWSIATGTPAVGFASAAVTVTKNGEVLPVTITAANQVMGGGYGDRAALIWKPVNNIVAPAAGQVDVYHVSITGITGHADVSYDVKMFNPLEATVASAAIGGTPGIGQTLTVSLGEVWPSGATVTYQWLRDGANITGATQPTYTVQADDAGHEVSVQVTAATSGYTSVPLTSAAVTIPEPWAPAYASLALSPDLNLDGRGEVVTIGRHGELFVHVPTAGVTKLVKAATAVATGLTGHQVYGSGDWDGDKLADLITVDASGKVWLRRGNGRGGFAAAAQIGAGWSAYRLVPAGDLNGDRTSDLLAIDAAGKLWLYASNGQGGFLGRTEVGHGWVGSDLYAAGDLNNDKRVDLLAVNAAGWLYAYFGKGDGTFQTALRVGQGWGGLAVAAGADLNGDGLADLLGRDNDDGTLYYYQSKGGGQFAAARQLATDW